MPDPAPLNYQSASEPIAWKEGSLLVARRKTDLSDRCICCGKPADGSPLSVKLYQSTSTGSGYHSGGGSSGVLAIIDLVVLLFQLIAVLVDVLEAMDRKVIVGLCAEHRQRRQNFRTAALIGVVSALICLGSTYFVWTLKTGSVARTIVAITLTVIPILLIWLAVVWAGKVPGLSMSKEAKGILWIRGASPAFLEQLSINTKPTPTEPGGSAAGTSKH